MASVSLASTTNWIASGVIVAVSFILAVVGLRIVSVRSEDRAALYHGRRAVRYAMVFLALVALAIVWRPFAGRIGLVLGLLAAGVAFAINEVLGAIAGWLNILTGRIFRVGDRVEMGGVRGDVIDITPVRTKIVEMGAAPDEGDGDAAGAWVRGRQYTGRIVTISNKATFTDPVYNYSAVLDFIWEELTIPVSYDADHALAEQILLEEAERISRSEQANIAIEETRRRYPVPRTELEPRVFLRSTDNYLELSARFVVSVRTARSVKSDMTRRVLDRLREAGIPIASATQDVTVAMKQPPKPRKPRR